MTVAEKIVIAWVNAKLSIGAAEVHFENMTMAAFAADDL